MMKNTGQRVGIFLIATTIISVVWSTNVAAFGKNKVQYFTPEWSYIQSEHFDVYFPQNGYTIAEFVAATAEDAYVEISASYNYEIRDRISIITYPSHNSFEATNVTFSSPEEGVGGFTEFFKNRVVIPYEGSYEQLRHVTHHELSHAIMMEMIYGGGIGSLLSSLSRMPLPLWFVEGLAEYESRHGWDTDSDLFMRDATINGYLPPISELGGFLNYKGGQSVLYYISQRYGPEKIGEILHKVKTARDLERGLKISLGQDIEELSKRWQKWLKTQYWPTVAKLDDPADIAKQLTDHVKDRNFVNNSPALSPAGDQIAFLSDRSDYFDIYLMSVVDGKIKKKLVSGQTSAKFEELHWLRPGLSWSPDGKYLTFASKAGKSDALHLIDVDKGDVVETIRFDLQGIFSPSYSPDGKAIAFVGLNDGQSDIYSFNLETRELSQVTNDIFSDLDPSWSPDGRYISFISDRGAYLGAPGDDFKMADFDYHKNDVYIIDVNTSDMKRVTNDEYNERTPRWSSKENILSYVCDRDGVYNLYLHNLDTSECYAITNLQTGCFQPSWSSTGSVAFSSFFDAGYDIYYLYDPFDPSLKRIPKDSVPYAADLGIKPSNENPEHGLLGIQATSSQRPMGRIVFDDRYQADQKKTDVFLDSTEYLTDSGDYAIKDYKIKFSPDIVYAAAGYSTFFGVQAMGLMLFSDQMGDHQIFVGLDVYSELENANAEFLYLYLPKRIDYGFGVHHNAYFFAVKNESDGSYTYYRDKYFGGQVFAQYPFSRYTRLEGNLSFSGIDRDEYDWVARDYSYLEKRRVFMGGLSWVHDTILWGSVGPVNGIRARLSVYASPNLEDQITLPGAPGWGLDFHTVTFDARKYLKIANGYQLAVRATGGFSEGSNPIQFYVGGVNNWINRRYSDHIQGDIEDIYFSNFVTPFRGGDYYTDAGTRYGLVNLEFRYPLIRHLVLGWPLPIHLQNIRGALFMDTAGTWDDNDFRGTTTNENGDVTFNDLMMGYGFGARVNLGIFVLRWDVAWRTYWDRTDSPRYYFSLGAEY